MAKRKKSMILTVFPESHRSVTPSHQGCGLGAFPELVPMPSFIAIILPSYASPPAYRTLTVSPGLKPSWSAYRYISVLKRQEDMKEDVMRGGGENHGKGLLWCEVQDEIMARGREMIEEYEDWKQLSLSGKCSSTRTPRQQEARHKQRLQRLDLKVVYMARVDELRYCLRPL